MVPERPGAGREAHIVGHAVEFWCGFVGGCLEDWIHVHCSCESFAWLARGSVGRMGAADELHGGKLRQKGVGIADPRVLSADSKS